MKITENGINMEEAVVANMRILPQHLPGDGEEEKDGLR
jgi:hypothetical protein